MITIKAGTAFCIATMAADIADEPLTGTIATVSTHPRIIASRVVQRRVAAQTNHELTFKPDQRLGTGHDTKATP